jgi:hypothetical protein
MQHRIYTKPFTRINEHWIFNAETDGTPGDPYKDSLIESKANQFHNEINDLQADWYKHVGIDIVTETTFNYPYPIIDEKILRPIFCKRMFILVAPMRILESLKNKGFRTFSPFINEEYDTISDPVMRINALTNEIDRLCAKPLHEIKEAITAHTDILDHNFNLMMSLEIKEFNELEKELDELI